MPAIEHGFEREDILLYDRKALGEAVVNAIAHRDYSLSGSQIRVFVFRDRIEVRSPGRLPNSVTLDNIKLGVHAERNRAIATLLTQLGYHECHRHGCAAADPAVVSRALRPHARVRDGGRGTARAHLGASVSLAYLIPDE